MLTNTRRLVITLAAVALLALGGCTWEQTLAWDDLHGLAPGTTNHVIHEVHGQNMQHPEHSHPWETPPAPAWTVWDDLAECEANGEWDYGPHSTWGSKIYEGGLQFHPTTWDRYKPAGYPAAAYQATREQQIVVGERVQDAEGWGAWPDCSRELNLR